MRSLAEVWKGKVRDYAPDGLELEPSKVNWSAIGPVEVERAKMFVRQLRRCIDTAERQNARLRREFERRKEHQIGNRKVKGNGGQQ